ncbi:uncharacterized protein LOC131601511 [Vicia villosa]|uniref:uncharacterized protein LOC131601511 n=1 Tax=Vicia villosa TaxID=3911 RepID=UPI00273AA48A|nr:uncharacterized protein LOC131601511 [Vicia villosa]
MKTKTFILMFILCALIINFVMGVEPFKDEKQFGAIEETKTNIGIRERVVWTKSWTNWRSRGAPVKGVGGGKLGGQGSSGSVSEGGAKSIGEQNESGKDKGSEPMEEEDEKI